MSDDGSDDLASATQAIRAGNGEEAVTRLEALADRGVVGGGIAFDRGLAYALRARSEQSIPGDLGRAAHAFEEALRRDPHDTEATRALDEVRHEIARRDARSGGRTAEVGASPPWRAIVTAAPGDVWAGLALAGSAALAIALLARARLHRGARLAASTIATVGLLVAMVASALGLGARHLRLHVREGVIVEPRVVAQQEGDAPPLDLSEGARVDVVEERAIITRVRTTRGEGWVPRNAVRQLPPWRP